MTDRRSNAQDHDLLIEINTKLGRVIDDVKELKDNMVKRVEALEEDKIDKTEFDKLLAEVDGLKSFKDTLTGKITVVAVVGAFLISLITAWLTKHI